MFWKSESRNKIIIVKAKKKICCNWRNCDFHFQMGETPIAAAAAANKVNVVQFLALSGCNINSHCYISPLATACHSKHYDIVRCLLSEGYNVSRDDTVQHSIFWSMEEEEPELIEYVRYRASHPLSLKHICRLHVRCLLGIRLYQVASKLEIPQILKDFLVTSSILSWTRRLKGAPFLEKEQI